MILATCGMVRKRSIFARKNYFYPDLPKGYQISQHDKPLGEGGRVSFDLDGEIHNVGLTRIHLEEDAGKSSHSEAGNSDGASTGQSLIDMNRCGVPLLEIVSEPEIHGPRQAHGFLLQLRRLTQYLGICSGDMEKGALRCDANLSIRPAGTQQFGTRTEIKNLNSFRAVERALTHEMNRQIEILGSGQPVVQETRLWNESENRTYRMRSKEESHDYRYFPEPDLVELRVNDAWIEGIRRSLPELPREKYLRFQTQYGLPPYDAEILTATRETAEYVEGTIEAFPDPKKVSNWIMTEVLRVLRDTGLGIDRLGVTPKQIGELLRSVEEGAISGKIAKEVFARMVETGEDPSAIVDDQDLRQITDERMLNKVVAEIVDKYPENVELYRDGKRQLLGFFVGQVMKATGGKANPELANLIVRKQLNDRQD
jgi:aspartyl-tRNA(Asn)/glutamyl-tRNA(Gln) amidotransferase subunit B